MPDELRRVVRVVAFLCLVIATPASAAEDAIRVAGEPRPAVLDLVDTSTPPIAIAVGPDGRHAAVSYPDPAKPRRSFVRIYSSYRDEPLEVGFSGIARSLLFSRDGLEVFVVLYRPAKKRLGESELLRLDVEHGKSRSIMQLPATSSCLDYWPARGSLLVAAVNEIRTIRVAGMRSGPLFRIAGLNLAVTALAGNTAVLVGQDREVLLVDLDDRSGEDGMPVRERAPIPVPVATLAALPDGSGALALLADGSLQRISFGPLTIEAVGSALALVELSKEENPRAIVMAPLPTPVEEEEEETEPSTDLSPAAAGAAATTLADAAEVPAAAAAPEPQAPTQAPSPSPAVDSTAATSLPWRENDAPQLWGRLSGDAVGEVREIILLGPDSIVREARRLRPEEGGIWRADDLEPGRYQVQLSAGGQKVLVTEPRVAIVEVPGSGSTEATAFLVLRAVVP